MIRIVVGAMLFALTACVSPKSRDKSPTQPERVPEFEQGLSALEREDYDSAAETFDRLLVQRPATEYDLIVLFNSGAAYEGMGKCDKALERYRRVVRSSAGRFERLQGESLYRSSMMYECLGQDAKAITAVLDARKHAKDLPYETQVAEMPARLAAAYARLGNREKALYYFNQASRGLKGVVSMDGRATQLERVAKTLFLMGRLGSHQKVGDVEPTTFLRSLSMQQPYLLQAVEMNQPVWSQKASDDLKIAYENIWRIQVKDPKARREFLTRSIQTMNELRKIRLPKANPRVESVFAMLDRNEIKIQNELAMGTDDPPLTPEAQRRQGLKREGKLVNPEEQKKGAQWKR